MKTIRILRSTVIMGMAALLFTSCAKLPQEEIDAANAAIAEAQTAGADVYVSESFVALQDSMNAVMEAVEVQNSKFFKNFTAEKEGLANVTALAQNVRQQSETRKEELKQEITNTIAEIKTLLEANNQLITEAPKGKEGTAAIEAIKAELAAIETSVSEATASLEQGELMASLDKARAAKEKASAINAELQEVIAKYKANVRR